MLTLTFQLETAFTQALPKEVVEQRLHDAGRSIHGELRARWPIKTGKSMRAWNLILQPGGFTLENNVRYTGFIKGGSAIIDSTLDAVAKQTAEQIAQQLPAAMLNEAKDG